MVSAADRELWSRASRIYRDIDDHRDPLILFDEWLARAKLAYEVGNFIHLSHAIRVCAELKKPLPKWLASASSKVIYSAAVGAKSGVGRQARMLRRVAEAVTEVEALMQIHIHRRQDLMLDARNYKRKGVRGETVYDRVAT